MMGFAGRACPVCGWVKQVSKQLIRKKCSRSKNDLGRSERECRRSPGLLGVERRDQRSCVQKSPVMASLMASSSTLYITVGVLRSKPGNPRQVLLKHSLRSA